MKLLIRITLTTMILAFFSTTAFGQQQLYNSLNKRMAILYKNGKIMEAIATANEVINVAEKTFGKNHAFYSAALENLALLYVNQGTNEKAAELYEESFQVRQGLLGNNDPRLKSILEKLEKCYNAMRATDKINSVKARMKSLQS
ncbi:MAG: tetratricopeptide repeat protein [Desulfobacteraceae bacterium]